MIIYKQVQITSFSKTKSTLAIRIGLEPLDTGISKKSNLRTYLFKECQPSSRVSVIFMDNIKLSDPLEAMTLAFEYLPFQPLSFSLVMQQ